MAHLIVRYVFRSPGKIKVVHLCHKAEPQTKLNTAFLFQKDRPTDSRNPSRFTTSEKIALAWQIFHGSIWLVWIEVLAKVLSNLT